MNPNLQVALIACGSGLLTLAFLKKTQTPQLLPTGPGFPALPPGPEPEPVPSQPGAMTPPPSAHQITGPLVAQPGKFYSVVVETTGALNLGASESAIASKATDLGFKSVQVFRQKPPGWPGRVNGQWYVAGTFGASAPKTLDRTVSVGPWGLGGHVNVLDVWEA